MYFHLSVTPPAFPAVPAHMNAAIQKALRKKRKDRFHSAAEFAAALRTPVAETPKRRVWIIPVAAASIVSPAVLYFIASAISSPPASQPASWPAPAPSPAPIAEKPIELLSLPILNPPPRVDTLPPIVEQARRGKSVALPRGIIKPTLLNAARVPANSIVADGQRPPLSL